MIRKETLAMFKLLDAGCVLDNFIDVKGIIKDFQYLEEKEYYKMLEEAKEMLRKQKEYQHELAIKYNWN